MNSSDLTRDQGLKVFLETREMLSRVYKLKARMEKPGFPADDPLYAATAAAWPAVLVMNQQWQAVSLGSGYSMRSTTEPP
jgi:hypothetical protein